MKDTNYAVSSTGRRTRSGTEYSPWVADGVYVLDVDLGDFIARAWVDVPTPLAEPSSRSERVEEARLMPDGRSDSMCLNENTKGVSRQEGRAEGAGGGGGGAHIEGNRVVPKGASDSHEPPGEARADFGANAGPSGSRWAKARASACVESSNEKKSRAERKKECTKIHKVAKRAEQRQKRQDAAGSNTKGIALKRIAASRQIKLGVDASHLRRTQRGYVGLGGGPPEHPDRTLDKLVSDGFQYIPWDGTSSISLFDAGRRLIIGGGSPSTPDWVGVSNRCAGVLNVARNECGAFTLKQTNHRRGKFPALAVGISYGQGQRRPGVLCNAEEHVGPLAKLFRDEDFVRIAGFQGSLFRSFAPDLAQEYSFVLEQLLSSQSELRRNFTNSDFATMTVNLGPQTVSIPHVDSANLVYGLCAITALGDFNADEGGHLVLWNLGVVIRFPPGSTLLVPSALIQHSNLPIQAGESRYSVTQYSAGSLFRWVYNGLCSDGARSQTSDQMPTEWRHGLDKFRMSGSKP